MCEVLTVNMWKYYTTLTLLLVRSHNTGYSDTIHRLLVISTFVAGSRVSDLSCAKTSLAAYSLRFIFTRKRL